MESSDKKEGGKKQKKFYMLDEFQGKYGYSREKAIYELGKHGIKAWHKFSGYKTLMLARVGSFLDNENKQIISIPTEEVDRYAAIKANENEDVEPLQSQSIPYMNKRHPAYTSELEAAVSCWLSLFADAPHGKVASHTKAKAIAWLKENRPKLSLSQCSRIATVLTPVAKKDGGCPPTE